MVAASDDLDEDRIAAHIEKGARIAVWGVGTRLVTGGGQGALGGAGGLRGSYTSSSCKHRWR